MKYEITMVSGKRVYAEAKEPLPEFVERLRVGSGWFFAMFADEYGHEYAVNLRYVESVRKMEER